MHEVQEGSYLGSELCGKYQVATHKLSEVSSRYKQARDINRARLYMIDVSCRHNCMVCAALFVLFVSPNCCSTWITNPLRSLKTLDRLAKLQYAWSRRNIPGRKWHISQHRCRITDAYSRIHAMLRATISCGDFLVQKASSGGLFCYRIISDGLEFVQHQLPYRPETGNREGILRILEDANSISNVTLAGTIAK